jgi:hypothetical protein
LTAGDQCESCVELYYVNPNAAVAGVSGVNANSSQDLCAVGKLSKHELFGFLSMHV